MSLFFFVCLFVYRSLGLAVPPRVRFLNKAQKPTDEVTQEISTVADVDSDVEIKSFKAHFSKDQSSNPDSDSEEEDEEEESDEEEKQVKFGGQLCSSDEDDEDLDLLTVKCKDVFNVSEDKEEEEVNDKKCYTHFISIRN